MHESELLNKEYSILSWSTFYTETEKMCIDMTYTSVTCPEDTIVLGICRGGLTLMTLVSNFLKLPYGIIKYQTRDGNDKEPKLLTGEFPQNNVIIVEDIIDSGKTINDVLKMPELKDKRVTVYSLYCYSDVKFESDIYIYAYKYLDRRNPAWIIFPWEGVL